MWVGESFLKVYMKYCRRKSKKVFGETEDEKGKRGLKRKRRGWNKEKYVERRCKEKERTK